MFVLVVAKEPVPGKVKTRLCPPCSHEQAAALAEAALADTLDAAVASGADRVLVALDGAPGPWLPEGVRTFAQAPGAFGDRLAAAWAYASGPGIQIGMDTPQVDAAVLDDAMAALDRVDVDAVLGPALDGGWWALGLLEADRRVFEGVPMSRPDTGRRQRDRLVEIGLRVADLRPMVDVDHFDEAVAVARLVPSSRFARAVSAVEETLHPGTGTRR